MRKEQVERLSKRNARAIIQGTDKLKSWGTSGWYKSVRLNKFYNFRSMIEANVIRTLDESANLVENFDTEVFMIPYQWKGATCNYVPDVIVKTKSGKVIVIEVKPLSQTNNERNQAKWSAAKTWCWSRGVEFIVVTDKDWERLPDVLDAFDRGDREAALGLLEYRA